jgi:hypothetical protein
MNSIFAKEEQNLAELEEMLKTENISNEDLMGGIKVFTQHFRDLLDQVVMLTKVSDRLQKKLDKTNEILNETNIELQNTIDELTLTKIDRKAKVIAYISIVILFLFSEVVIEPSIDFISNSIYMGLLIKAIIALLIKPIEEIFEHFMLKRAGFKLSKTHKHNTSAGKVKS